MRASFLVTVFLPFLLLGPILLLLASQFAPSASAQAQAAGLGAAAGTPGTSDQQVENDLCCLMCVSLCVCVCVSVSVCLSLQ